MTLRVLQLGVVQCIDNLINIVYSYKLWHC